MKFPEAPSQHEGQPHPFEERRDQILKDIALIRKDLQDDSGPMEEEVVVMPLTGEKVVFGGAHEEDGDGETFSAELDRMVERIQKLEPSDVGAEQELQLAQEKLDKIIDELATDPNDEDFF